MLRPPSIFLTIICLAASPVFGANETVPDDLPEVIPLGQGSYASRPPRSQAARPGVNGKAGWGDLSPVFTHMKLYVTEDHPAKEAIPSTDWWTSLVTKQW